MKRIRKIALKTVIYAAAAAVLSGGGWWGYKLYKKTSAVEADIEKVSVSKGDIEVKFQDVGDVNPRQLVEVFAKVGGILDEIRVTEGEGIVKGQKIAMVQPGQSEADKYLPVEVISPLSGTVMPCEGRGWNEEAAMAKAGQRISGVYDSGNPTCLMQIGDMSQMIVKLNVSEMEVLKLKKNMAVKVTVDALPFLDLAGRISLISPKAEKDNRSGVKSFRVEVGINQQAAALRPGMTARIETVIDSKKNILKMPISGLFEESGKRFAYLYVPGGKAKKADVATGLRNEIDVEILNGLKEGDQVYTDKPLNIEADKPAVNAGMGAPGKTAGK
ncbi:MAG: efflux RND transporter periplasmic adaptor subunit [Elusimicrobia bacterium]|nr:efflux RND transporter periplasmic adaptor subunit [Elusimicrobiota bacterium]